MAEYRRSRNALNDPVKVALFLEKPAREKLLSTAATLPGANKSTIVQWLLDSMELDEYGIPVDWPNRSQIIEEMSKDNT